MDLTSDKTIRQVAYTNTEWISNGGSLLGYGQVASQDEPPEITKNNYGNLLGIGDRTVVRQDSGRRAKNITAHWQKVQAHACYIELNKNENFREAWKKFEAKIQRPSAPKKYKSEFAKFRFYDLVTLHIKGSMIAQKAGQKTVYPDAKVIKKSLGHIKKLLEDFDKGIKLQDYSDHKNLKNYLTQLCIELSSAPRKDKETNTAPARRVLEGFAKSSIYAFGEASATILFDLAEMMGWYCDPTTMDDVVKSAKTKHRKELALK